MVCSKKILFEFFVFINCALQAQFISNPSFEAGFVGAYPPDGWNPCNANSTPDTQPIEGELGLTASNGQTFLAMAARGKNTNDSKNEGIQTYLLKPLLPGACYRLSIDLARTFVTDTDNEYPDAMKLFIWGGKENCDKSQKLIETGYIEDSVWQNYSFILHPDDVYNVLMMEVIVDDDKKGYMSMDNLNLMEIRGNNAIIKLDTTVKADEKVILNASNSNTYTWRPSTGLTCYDCQTPELESVEYSQTYICTVVDGYGCAFDEVFSIYIKLFIPNVFSPNNDGFNDKFRIDGLFPGSKLHIYNRLGQLVFESNDYKNNWDGYSIDHDILPEDNYWYVLEIQGDNNLHKGKVYLIR